MPTKLTELLLHPDEITYLYRLYIQQKAYQPSKKPLELLALELNDKDFCYATLSKVSRSFSVVIQQLPENLKDAVCIFYLVLRALDSIEDDTSTDRNLRIELLSDFYKVLNDNEWKINDVGDKKEYRILLEHFHKVTNEYQKLDSGYQEVIQRICQQMGAGMIQYLDKELDTVQDYDKYCYYVAGLVGIGLTELFVKSGLQDEKILDVRELAISMGLFLQKTNIIRDYHEDFLEQRTFWPKEIWGLYAHNLEEFVLIDTDSRIHCLNHMVTDALRHTTDCLAYLRMISDPQIFNFCVIPQVMAIATLAEVFNNSEVFNRNVKIRKGMAARLILSIHSFEDAYEVFTEMASKTFKKLTLDDPNLKTEISELQHIMHFGGSSEIKIQTQSVSDATSTVHISQL